MVLLPSRYDRLAAGLAQHRSPLALLIFHNRLADLLHLFVLGRDLRGERLAARNPVRRQLVRLLGQLGVPGLKRLVLGPFVGEVGVERGGPLLEADFRRQELLPIEAPLDLVGLQYVPVLGHHPELLA